MIDGLMQILSSLFDFASIFGNIISNVLSSLGQLITYAINAGTFLSSLFGTYPHFIYGGILSMGITTGIGAIVLRIIIDLL